MNRSPAPVHQDRFETTHPRHAIRHRPARAHVVRATAWAALLAAASACAHPPRRVTPQYPPGIATAVMPLGLPDDIAPCQVARPELRAPVAPERVVTGPELSHERLPVSAGGRGGSTEHGVLSPDGETVALVTLGDDEVPRLLLQELRTGRELAAIDSVWASGTETLAYSRDGRWIASGDGTGTVRVVSAAHGRVHRRLPHDRHRPENLPPVIGAPPEATYREVTSVALSADGRHVVSTGEDGNVILWDVRRGRARWIHDMRGGEGHPPRPLQAAFLADGRLLVVSPRGLEVWSAERGTVAGMLPLPVGAVPSTRGSVAVTRYSGVVDVAVSGDGRLVAVHGRSTESDGSQGHFVADWIETWWWGECPEPGRPIRIAEPIGTIRISPGGRWIAAIGNEAVHVWDAFTGLERFRIAQSHIRTLTGDIARSVTFDPDETVLYTIHSDPRPVIAWSLTPRAPAGPPR